MSGKTLRQMLSSLLLPLSITMTCTLASRAEKPQQFDLTPLLEAGDKLHVDLSLKVGGNLITNDEKGVEARLPVSAEAGLTFDEQLVDCERGSASRSIRNYSRADATIKVDDAGDQSSLSTESTLIIADADNGQIALGGLEALLSRDELDLIKVVADPLVLDQILPRRKIAVGDGWDHKPEQIAALLGLDNVATCAVRSMVKGAENNQIKITLSGSASGSIEGASTDVELRAAYLYHVDYGRITKFNMAIKEQRKVGPVAPGLDIVAKFSLVVRPNSVEEQLFEEDAIEKAANLSRVEIQQLEFESVDRGCRFRHDANWFVTAVPPDQLSLRLLLEGDLVAHCNLRSLPAKVTEIDGASALKQLQSDVRQALGNKLRTIASASQWQSPAGNQCAAVFANGEIDGVPMQWRYYLVQHQGRPQIAVSVTVEQSQLGLFANADRALIDSLELLEKQTKTAQRPTNEREQK